MADKNPLRLSNKNNNSGQKITARESGFTLLEVILAVVLFFTGITGLLNVMGSAVSSLGIDRKENFALYLAQQKIEQLKARDFADIVDEARINLTINFPRPALPALQDQTYYQQVRVTYPIGGNLNLKQVEVMIYWQKVRQPVFDPLQVGEIRIVSFVKR